LFINVEYIGVLGLQESAAMSHEADAYFYPLFGNLSPLLPPQPSMLAKLVAGPTVGELAALVLILGQGEKC
jgi:hypothetical protein